MPENIDILRDKQKEERSKAMKVIDKDRKVQYEGEQEHGERAFHFISCSNKSKKLHLTLIVWTIPVANTTKGNIPSVPVCLCR